eukprot:g35355.t1
MKVEKLLTRKILAPPARLFWWQSSAQPSMSASTSDPSAADLAQQQEDDEQSQQQQDDEQQAQQQQSAIELAAAAAAAAATSAYTSGMAAYVANQQAAYVANQQVNFGGAGGTPGATTGAASSSAGGTSPGDSADGSKADPSQTQRSSHGRDGKFAKGNTYRRKKTLPIHQLVYETNQAKRRHQLKRFYDKLHDAAERLYATTRYSVAALIVTPTSKKQLLVPDSLSQSFSPFLADCICCRKSNYIAE